GVAVTVGGKIDEAGGDEQRVDGVREVHIRHAGQDHLLQAGPADGLNRRGDAGLVFFLRGRDGDLDRLERLGGLSSADVCGRLKRAVEGDDLLRLHERGAKTSVERNRADQQLSGALAQGRAGLERVRERGLTPLSPNAVMWS